MKSYGLFVLNTTWRRDPVPKKKTFITDAERAKRLEEAAHEYETSDDPKAFERAFKRVVPRLKPNAPKRP